MRVLRSRDGRWRAEERRDGWRLEHLGGLVLERATLDRLAAFLIDRGVDPTELIED